MASPGTPLGRYLRFLMSTAAYTPNSNKAVIPFDTQNPLSRATHLPVGNIGSHIHSMRPTVFPSSSHFFLPSWVGLSLPSTICALHRMEVRAQQIVCRSLPKGCGLRPTHINPGDHLLNHSIMDSSRTLIHDGKNCWAILWFQASSNWRICKKPSSYGTSLFVKRRALRIESNQLQDMIRLSLNVATLAIDCVVVDYQFQRLSIPTHHAMYSQQPTHFINSWISIGTLRPLLVSVMRTSSR